MTIEEIKKELSDVLLDLGGLSFSDIYSLLEGDSAITFEGEDLIKIARHFAKWQREKDIKLKKIDDLEVFAQKWAYSNYHQEQDGINCDCLYSGVKKGVEWYENHMKEILQTEYEKGRFDMRKEMMKDAIVCVVEDWCGDSPEITIPLNLQDFKTDDKVKIIIVKEV